MKPQNISLKLGAYDKHSRRYCGPFEILERIGILAYKHALLVNIKTYNIFHVSLLKKYVHYFNH
jgi:hypothetical protein